MLIDTHVHLNFKAFKKDLDQVIERAKKSGVEKMIVVGSDLKSSEKAVELARKYKSLYASVGIHPHHVNSLDYNTISYYSQLREQLTKLAQQNKVVAIGETGLDWHQYKNSRYQDTKITPKIENLQKTLFKLHLDLAKKLNLPLILHCRQAFDDLLEILSLEAKVLKQKGVLHCFEGNKNHLEKALNLGFYIGFNGLVTYPERKKLKSLVKITPIERILLETDSPFLTPETLRGARNEPKNLKIIARKIAHLKNISLANVEKRTTHNSHSLFFRPKRSQRGWTSREVQPHKDSKRVPQ